MYQFTEIKGITMEWSRRAEIIYKGTKWEAKAIESGKLIDKRLNSTETNLFGDTMAVSHFDLFQYFAYFDYETLKIRGLENKELEFILSPSEQLK